MKKQSQIGKNGSRKAAASQAQNTPNPVRTSPDKRAGEQPIPGGITLIIQDERFTDLERVHCGPELRDALEKMQAETGIAPQEFVRRTLASAVKEHLAPISFPNMELERTVNASVALFQLLEHYLVFGDGRNLIGDLGEAFKCGIVDLCGDSTSRLLAIRDSLFAYNNKSKGGAH